MNGTRQADVCVIGGGPAGCWTAWHLARAGYDVVVCEEHEAIGEPVDCSGIIGCDVFAALGLPRESIMGTLPAIDLVAPGGASLHYNSGQPLASIVNRAAFDQSLAALARGAGAEILTSSSVVALDTGDREVRLSVSTRAGLRDLRARAVVLANGPRYRFQEALGMGRPARFLATIQAEGACASGMAPKVFFGRTIAPGSFAWSLPLGSRAKFGVSASGKHRPRWEAFAARLRQDDVQTEGLAPKGWLIPIAPIPRSFARRVVAVGDAAGQTKPTTGGGLYYGLLCAEMAADVLADGLRRDDLSLATLSAYEAKWKWRLGKELRTAAMFRQLVERLSDRELDGLFGLLRRERTLRLILRRADFDWHHNLILDTCRVPRVAFTLIQGFLRSWLPV